METKKENNNEDKEDLSFKTAYELKESDNLKVNTDRTERFIKK
jgi:hypothetical protein